jgi:hypothetical protein
MREYYQVVLMRMDTKEEMEIGFLQDELSTRYLILQFAICNQNPNHIYFARHITLHKLQG